MNRLFLDAAYVVALAVERDQFHDRAVDLSAQIEEERLEVITTRAVLLEIGNYLTRIRHREAAVRILEAVEQDPAIEIVPLTDEIYFRGLNLYRGRMDKEWSLTDCISFIVMGDSDTREALTADVHFQQAGFTILLN